MARYAFSDLHGRLDLFNKIIDFIQPDDIVYCLGDCGDRGPDSWATIKAVYEHPQCYYLKGNHEDMLIRAMKTYLSTGKLFGHDYNLLVYNGGLNTFEEWLKEKDFADWVIKLDELPTIASLKNDKNNLVIMTHAGYTPGGELPCEDDLLWDRIHLYDPFPNEYQNTIIIHGHTPIQYIKREGIVEIDSSTLAYSDGHKINLDCGAVNSGVVALINLDTYEIHKLYGSEWD